MNNSEDAKARNKAAGLASWIFGTLLLLFLILVFTLAPENLPPYKHRQLGFLCALLAGLFVYFFIGANEIVIRHESRLVRMVFRAGGGASLFALVLLWWGSPYSIVGLEKNIDAIREGTTKLVEDAQRTESQSIDWLSPHISAFKAYDHVAKVFGNDISKYELIEVLGSYYICLEPPKRTFLRFPEWIFTFRQKDTHHFVQYQIYESSVPRPPSMTIRGNLSESDILYYSVLKEQYDDIQLRRNLEVQRGKRLQGNSFSLFFFDIRNLMYKADGGLAPDDQLIETRDSDRFKVMGRYQALGRLFANPPTRGVKIQDFDGKYEVRVESAEVTSNDYLNSLVGFEREEWKVDVDEAIAAAVAKGAVCLSPGQLNYPGLLRLYYKKTGNLDGIYWHIPYLVDLSYLVVNAENSGLFIMSGANEFTAK